MNSSFELLLLLKKAGYLKAERDAWWWPHSGTFWVVVGAILTQQTRWDKVEKSLDQLHNAGLNSLEAIAQCDQPLLAELIKPSGFYNTKAKCLRLLCHHSVTTFGDFDSFCANVSREWLLMQRGIGPESADSILCYGCLREAMVVDAYTARLLEAFGYTFERYDDLQAWMVEGLIGRWDQIEALYGYAITPAQLYARFHGKIVEFCKSQGRKISIESLGA